MNWWIPEPSVKPSSFTPIIHAYKGVQKPFQINHKMLCKVLEYHLLLMRSQERKLHTPPIQLTGLEKCLPIRYPGGS